MKIKQDSGEIIRRLKSGLGVDSDEELADILGIYSERILFWRKYNTLNYELDLNFLFSHTSASGIDTDVVLIHRKHQFDYASSRYKKYLINQMPRHNFSSSEKGSIRAFETTGFSLFSLCKEDSYVIGEFVRHIRHLIEGDVYVFVRAR